MAGSRSALKEGDLEPMCFQLIDFQIVVKALVPGPASLTERSAKQAQKKEKPFDSSLVVDQTPKISNLLEDIKKVERFVQYIENQRNENLLETEPSQK